MLLGDRDGHRLRHPDHVSADLHRATLASQHTGPFFIVYSVTAFITRLATRRMPHRFGVRPMIFIGLAALAVSLFLYLPVSSQWGAGHSRLFLPASRTPCCFRPSTAQGSSSFPSRYRGLGTTLMLAMLDLGTFVGAPLVGGLVDFSKSSGLPPYATTFVVSGRGRGARRTYCTPFHASSCSIRSSQMTPKSPAPPAKTRRKSLAYGDDLAYIHDAGFGAVASGAAPWLVELLRSHGLTDGLVIDLGCGSGIWAACVVAAGYGVVGFDISPAMVAMCARRVPRGEFHAGRLFLAELRPCVAVTAIGEIFNYLFDKRNSPSAARRPLPPRPRGIATLRGLFVFDVATPGRVSGRTSPQLHARAPTGPACSRPRRMPRTARSLAASPRFAATGRRIVAINEVHRLRLYDPPEIAGTTAQGRLSRAHREGLRRTKFPPGYVGFVAQKRLKPGAMFTLRLRELFLARRPRPPGPCNTRSSGAALLRNRPAARSRATAGPG